MSFDVILIKIYKNWFFGKSLASVVELYKVLKIFIILHAVFLLVAYPV